MNTDEYEGHTTDWEWKDIGVSLAICSNGEAICFDTPDGNLAQDAPLLLAEVKRLREQLGRYTQFVLWVEEEHNEVFDEYERKDEL